MPQMNLFRSAFADGQVSPAQILAFHRLAFGDVRMENDPPPNPDPNPKPTPPNGKAEVGPNGFPEATPIADMTPEHQAAYWKHQSRKHEDAAKARADYEAVKAERDQLKAATLTDTEKAIDEARKDERAKAETETAAKFQASLVRTKLEAALVARRFPVDKAGAQVEFIDHTKFLTPAGDIDADKVKQYAEGIVPGGQWPDMGGGRRGAGTAPAGQAGRDEATRRFGDPDKKQ